MKTSKNKLIKHLLNIAYPTKCMFCKTNIKVHDSCSVCANCLSRLPYTKNGGCFESMGGADYLISPLLYKGVVKKAIHDLKFKSKYENAEFLALTMCGYLFSNKQAINSDVIVSVPLSKKSLLKRGFNQTELIASKISETTGILYDNTVLEKIFETKRQSSLKTFNERTKNVLGAYRCTKDMSEKTVLLIDDVYTSGMTIYNCAKELKLKGASTVIAVTCANAHKSKGYSTHDYKASHLIFEK